jgi:hypothetical protein
VAIFGVGTLVGCSPHAGSSTGGAAGTSPGVAGTPAGGAGGAAQSNGGTGGAQSDGGAGQPAAGGATTTHVGQVLLQSRVRGGNTVTVSARFTSRPAPTADCTIVKDGPCSLSTCPISTEAESLPTYASAGTVTVTSPEVMGTATLTPSADGSYPTPVDMFFQKVFDGEEHVQFKASGDVVPAFEGEVDVPLVLLISQPPFAAGKTSVGVPRTQDLSLSWTRGVEGVFLYFVATSQRLDGQPGSTGITCQFPSEAGTAVVKSSLLQQLKPASPASLFTVAYKIVTAGDYRVSLGVTMPTANPDKAILPNLTLE